MIKKLALRAGTVIKKKPFLGRRDPVLPIHTILRPHPTSRNREGRGLVGGTRRQQQCRIAGLDFNESGVIAGMSYDI